MDNQDFELLLASAQEALSIAKGEVKPSRQFTQEIPDVKKVREKTGLSQIQFANCLHISYKTLQNWEQGRRKPTGTAIVLMNLINKNPDLILSQTI